MSETLDISSFQNAVAELDRMYAYARSPAVAADPVLSGYMRTAVIKGFEYCYELSHKFMRRFLDVYGPERENENEYGFRTLLQLSQEYGIVEDVNAWLLFRDKRNITSHTYERSKAEEVFAVISAFLTQAHFVIAGIEKKLKADS
jgi:nucleotidyltransferase substrate binding protein (TIGR01987 family)